MDNKLIVLGILIIIIIIALVVGYFLFNKKKTSSTPSTPSTSSTATPSTSTPSTSTPSTSTPSTGVQELDSYNAVNNEVERIINDRQAKYISFINYGKELNKPLGETSVYKDLVSKINDKFLGETERLKNIKALDSLIASQKAAIDKYNIDVDKIKEDNGKIRNEIIQAQSKYPRDFINFRKETERILSLYPFPVLSENPILSVTPKSFLKFRDYNNYMRTMSIKL